MPLFKLDGYGRKTGRQRHPQYEARDVEDAIAKAEADATIVDVASVKRAFRIRHFFTKVVGVTHENPDGTDRQQIVSRCVAGEPLMLTREPRNPYSSSAVAVKRRDGEQIGYIPDAISDDIFEVLRTGVPMRCYASEITGGSSQYPTFGLNLLIVRPEDASTPDEEIARYLREKVGRRY